MDQTILDNFLAMLVLEVQIKKSHFNLVSFTQLTFGSCNVLQEVIVSQDLVQ